MRTKTPDVTHADFMVAMTRAGLSVEDFVTKGYLVARARSLAWWVLMREMGYSRAAVARKSGWDTATVGRAVKLADAAITNGDDLASWAHRDHDAWVGRIIRNVPGDLMAKIDGAWRAGARLSAIARSVNESRHVVRKHLPGRVVA